MYVAGASVRTERVKNIIIRGEKKEETNERSDTRNRSVRVVQCTRAHVHKRMYYTHVYTEGILLRVQLRFVDQSRLSYNWVDRAIV